jgi:hypothetical protein
MIEKMIGYPHGDGRDGHDGLHGGFDGGFHGLGGYGFVVD